MGKADAKINTGWKKCVYCYIERPLQKKTYLYEGHFRSVALISLPLFIVGSLFLCPSTNYKASHRNIPKSFLCTSYRSQRHTYTRANRLPNREMRKAANQNRSVLSVCAPSAARGLGCGCGGDGSEGGGRSTEELSPPRFH